jgi:murein tripeptide amidase MpaA
MLLAALALALAAAPAAPDLLTTAERTAFERTGRHDEAVRLCRAYEKAFPRKARCFSFGTTPEGRALVALAASADGVLDPAAARARRRPVVLFQGGIHAGEIDGKDAGFIVLRELLAAKGPSPLARVTAVFVPILNVDGHERFGPNHRPNQRGPAEMGWRTTAQNYNLNRDYVKADAPETRAILALLGAWDPIVYADLHVTDGAQFEHDVAILVEPKLGYARALRAEGAALSDALLERLAAAGHLPLDFYPSFVKDDEPASGFRRGVAPPRFGNDYWAARNRLGILVETHSWRRYDERVKTTADVLRALLALAAERGAAWRAAADRADGEAAALAGTALPLAWTTDEDLATPIRFRGYAYTQEASVITGAPMVGYDEARPAIWEIPLFERVRPSVVVTLPRAGWIVPAARAAEVAPLLGLHGVRFERLAAPRRALPVQVFRATEVQFKPEPFEGRQTATVSGSWSAETRDVGAGALFVPVAQPGAQLAAHLLEPTGPDSLAAWGIFNTVFERKEYVEAYVLEPFARDLLARDPAVRAEFERRLEDPAFAQDPKARLEFFDRRHPAYDAAHGVVPVLRVDAAPVSTSSS